MATTKERIAHLAARASEGVPLHQPGDAPLKYSRLSNGRALAEPDPEKEVFSNENTFTKHQVRLSTLNIPQLASLGARLRSARLARRLSFGQVSASTGISRSAIHNLETGRRTRPMLDILWGLADCYGLSLDQLVGRVA